MQTLFRGLALAGLLGLFMNQAHAAAGTTSISTEAPSKRMERPLSIYLGINSPAPTLIGVNVGYSFNDMLRAYAGYGSLSVTTSVNFTENGVTTEEATVDTLGAGIEATWPGLNVTPVAGIKAAVVSYSGAEGLEVGGFEESGTHIYSNIGMDWQAESGFNMGFGYNLSFSGSEKSSTYLNMGWAFDWLKI